MENLQFGLHWFKGSMWADDGFGNLVALKDFQWYASASDLLAMTVGES